MECFHLVHTEILYANKNISIAVENVIILKGVPFSP